MPSYKAPVRDMQFILHEVFNITEHEQLKELPGFGDIDAETTGAIFSEAARYAEDVLLPTNAVGDRQGCTLHNGHVKTPDGFVDAYKHYIESGWSSISGKEEYGGQGLPYVMQTAMSEMVSSTNMAFGMYLGLTHAAIKSLNLHGTDQQKALYLPKLVSGEWSGTMNLTEPHAGTDLGILRTKAVPNGDDSFAITGTKIFISAGEHDLCENIIHLVLARLPDAPEGVKGISLFIVPKFMVNEDGSLGNRNNVSCGSLEEKMGIHGNSTCVMNYDGATGFLIGQPHKGLKAMFTMMNEARLAVALQGYSQAEAAYQNAAVYARDRVQGRSLTGVKYPDKNADPIVVHPDIRRMLLIMRSFTESARAVTYWAALYVDRQRHHPEESVRQTAEDMLGLLTPIMKAYFTDMGFECANLGLQCFGGHGYIKEWGMEQLVRDARIAQIYEGANGIQALDLVGRKLPANGGRGIQTYLATVAGLCEPLAKDERLGSLAKPVVAALEELLSVGQYLQQEGPANPDEVGAAAYSFLRMAALATLSYMWVRMAKTAHEQLDAGAKDREFYEDKCHLAQFFIERMLPEVHAEAAKIRHGSQALMAIADHRL